MDMLSDSNKWPVIHFGALVICFSLPSRSLTWNLKMAPWNRRFRTRKPSFSGSMSNLGSVSQGECKSDLFSPVSLPPFFFLKHIKFSSPKLSDTNNAGTEAYAWQFQGWVFPYIKPYPYSLYEVFEFLHFRCFTKCLGPISAPKKTSHSLGYFSIISIGSPWGSDSFRKVSMLPSQLGSLGDDHSE